MTSLSGILPIDKPVGPTSHDIVAAARRALGIKRIGHTGTLDPFASGLLLLCLGPATRLAEYLTAQSKGYDATLVLGISTETDDSEGDVVSRSDGWREVDLERLTRAAERQTGEILQVPAKYSAKKVRGERMYDVARRGGEVNLPPVPVTVSSLRITRFAPPETDFEVECSSGTYIRSIARDIGAELGVGAHLTRLRRIRVGSFSVRDALPLEGLGDPPTVLRRLLPPAEAVAHLPRVQVSESERAVLRTGGALSKTGLPAGSVVGLVDAAGELLAIGEQLPDRIQPRKVFL